jgi:hypothetical protein
MKRLIATFAFISALCVPLAASAYTLGPTSPGKWGPPVMGTGATITWSLMPNGTACDGGPCTSFASAMPAGWQAAVASAFSMWSSVANLTFIQVPDDGNPFNGPTSSGDIRIGLEAFDGPGGVLAHGFYPPNNGNTAAGDIHFDIAELWKIGFGGAGFDIVQVLAHELGHALGLNHSGVPNSLMNPFYTEAFLGPQADDIAGMQFIYGRAVQPVPEPAALALMALALVLLTLARRRASFS